MGAPATFVHPPPGVDPPRIPEEGTIVVRVPNWVGDAVMSLPALTAITERFDRHTILVMARGNVAPLFVGQKRVSEVIRAGGRGAGRLAAARREMEARRVVLGVVLPHSMGSAAEMAVGGIEQLWGYGGPVRRLALNVALPSRWYRGRHRWEEYAVLAAAVTGRPVPERYPIVTGSGDVATAEALYEESDLDAFEGPVVGLVPTSNAISRRWPAERFAAIASRLGREGARVVVFGTSREAALTSAIAASADPRPVDWTGRSTLPVLAELLRRLDFLVTNDTGPMHLAYAVGTPLLALFGASPEDVTAPRGVDSEVLVHPIFCRPCNDNRCAYNLGCMRGITVDRVVEHVLGRLDGAGAVRSGRAGRDRASPGGDPGPADPPRAGVTGTAVEDTIVRPGEPPARDMGGIYYAVHTLCSFLSDRAIVTPVLAVGADAYDRVRDDFAALPGVETTGLSVVDEVNNKVLLEYRGPEEREETLTGGVLPLSWETLEPWVDRLDAWLWNFVAGNETDRSTFARVKREFRGPVHLDVHSLCLEHRTGEPRRPRRPERWEEWIEGTTWVQCNEQEAGMLWSEKYEPLPREEEAAFAERCHALGVEGVLVTRGADGVRWHPAGGDSRDEPAVGTESAVDPTGCGDVLGAAWFGLRTIAGMPPAEALTVAVRIAGAAAGVQGTEELRSALTRMKIPGGRLA